MAIAQPPVGMAKSLSCCHLSLSWKASQKQPVLFYYMRIEFTVSKIRYCFFGYLHCLLYSAVRALVVRWAHARLRLSLFEAFAGMLWCTTHWAHLPSPRGQQHLLGMLLTLVLQSFAC